MKKTMSIARNITLVVWPHVQGLQHDFQTKLQTDMRPVQNVEAMSKKTTPQTLEVSTTIMNIASPKYECYTHDAQLHFSVYPCQEHTLPQHDSSGSERVEATVNGHLKNGKFCQCIEAT